MRLTKPFLFLAVLFLIFVCTVPATAGPLFPCVKAVSSSNGNFLVLIDGGPVPEQGITGGIQRVSLRVFPKEIFINAKDRVTVPATYWTDWQRWSVVLDGSQLLNIFGCPLPLITDDGEFLVLLHIGAAFDDTRVLQIYRRRDHLGDPVRQGPDHGVFIKEIVLKEIWPAGKLGVTMWTDETPEWFAGGTFNFSPDCRQLTHRTRWGNTVSINLQDGSISRMDIFPEWFYSTETKADK